MLSGLKRKKDNMLMGGSSQPELLLLWLCPQVLEWECQPCSLPPGQAALEVGVLSMAHKVDLHENSDICSTGFRCQVRPSLHDLVESRHSR